MCKINKKKFTVNATKTVEINPPIKPSHVFLGESSIKGVLPKEIPNI